MIPPVDIDDHRIGPRPPGRAPTLGDSLVAPDRTGRQLATILDRTVTVPIAVAVVLALLLGAGLSVQTGVNTSLRTVLGHPVHATIVSFVVGTVALLAVALAIGLRTPPAAALNRAPLWMYLGGIIGAIYVAGSIVLAPRLGAATLIALIVTGQLVAALVIDHFGWLGFPESPVSWVRIVGGALLIVGVVLVRRG